MPARRFLKGALVAVGLSKLKASIVAWFVSMALYAEVAESSLAKMLMSELQGKQESR